MLALRFCMRHSFPRSDCSVFFFNDTATTEIYTLSLHDALPISSTCHRAPHHAARDRQKGQVHRSEEHTSELQSRGHLVCRLLLEKKNKMTSSLGRPQGDTMIRKEDHAGIIDCYISRVENVQFEIKKRIPTEDLAQIFLLRQRRPPRPTLLPYTTLFR